MALGRTQVVLTFSRNGTHVIECVASISPTSGRSLISLIVIYVAMAICMSCVGLLVALVAARHPTARAYMFLSFSGSAFLGTIVDYHTSCQLVWLFPVSYGAAVFGIAWVAWSFPSPLGLRTRWRHVATLMGAGWCVLTAWAAIAPMLGKNPTWICQIFSVGAGAALVALAVGTLARWKSSTGRERLILRSSLWGLGVVPFVTGMGVLGTMVTSPRLLQSFIPLGGFFIPLSVGYAIIKHNVFDARAPLSRPLLLAPIALLSLTLGLLFWVVIDALPSRVAAIVLPAASIIVLTMLVFVVLRRLAEHHVFHAAPRFQPTLTAWTNRISASRDPGAVLGDLGELVRQSESVEDAVVMAPDQLAAHTPVELARLARGEVVWVGERHEDQRLLVPMRAMGDLHAVLVVRPRALGGMLSTDDMLLLGAIASLGATALCYQNLNTDLERLRRLEAALTGMLAHEVLHEIAKPLLFLRLVLTEGRVGPLEEETLREAEVQIRRLERLCNAFKHRRAIDPRREFTRLDAVLAELLPVVRSTARPRGVTIALEVPEAISLRADADTLSVILGNLLRNAVEASEDGGVVTMRVHDVTGESNGNVPAESSTGPSLFERAGTALDVCDRGRGVADESELFKPFRTTKVDGSGVGLAACARLTRLLGWEIGHQRMGDTTVFRVLIPSSDDVHFA